jgi:hypothetical protein
MDKSCVCPLCLDSPPVLIMDGKEICINADKLHHGFYHMTSCSEGTPHARDHTGEQRAAIQNCRGGATPTLVRRKLVALSLRACGQGCSKSHPDVTPMIDGDVMSFLGMLPSPWVGVVQLICALAAIPCSVPDDMLNSEHPVCPMGLLMLASRSAGDRTLSTEEIKCIKNFLMSLASNSPVCSYFSQKAVDLVESAMNISTVTDANFMQAFHEASPIAYGVWKVMSNRGLHMSFAMPVWKACWSRLCSLSTLCHTGFDGGPLLPVPVPASCTGAYVTLGNCSGNPRVRDRHPCAIDGQGRSVDDEAVGCRHAFFSSRKKTGGVFTLFCQHGICLAFFILPSAEGRSEVYSYIIKHFKTPPKLIVYDFACALEKFFLNRAPWFVKYTVFVIDRFHWVNHLACSKGYNVSLYPQHNGINTQAAEQANSCLCTIAKSASLMTQEHCMLNMAFFLSCFNMSKKLAIDAESLHLAHI